MKRKTLVDRVEHPPREVVNLFLKLADAENHARGVTLTLRETSTMLTHVRNLIRLVRWEVKGEPPVFMETIPPDSPEPR